MCDLKMPPCPLRQPRITRPIAEKETQGLEPGKVPPAPTASFEEEMAMRPWELVLNVPSGTSFQELLDRDLAGPYHRLLLVVMPALAKMRFLLNSSFIWW